MPLSDPCATVPCLNNGDCYLDVATMSYTCACFQGFYGQQCQYSDEGCSGYCFYNGGCVLRFDKGTPSCECTFPYYGKQCLQPRKISVKYVDCFLDDGYDPVDFVTSASTGPECANALIEYRKSNPKSNYIYSVMSGSTGKCGFAASNPLTSKPNFVGLIGLALTILQALLGTCKTGSVKSKYGSVYVLNDLCANMDCGQANDFGYCFQSSATKAECVCRLNKGGDKCAEDVEYDPCATDTTCPDQCVVTDDKYGKYCGCSSKNQLTACMENSCEDDSCFNGGTCFDNGNGTYYCECLNLYSGEKCENFEPCYEDKCKNNGTCIPTYNLLDSTYECNCTVEWKGENCEIENWFCEEEPCQNNGNCTDIENPRDYECSCPPEWEGKNCTIDVDECALNLTLCSSKAPNATCINTEGSFSCICGDEWLGVYCIYNKMIYEILNSTYGGLESSELEEMTIELTNDPTLVRDIVPFLIGTYDSETRKNLSWTSEDLFLWVAYEEQLIDINQNFYQWNDKVLGNCYTFNHHNSTFKYKARNPGFSGGLEMQINVKQNEYLPWIETSSIMIFTSKKGEAVTSESIRVTSTPGYESRVTINRKDYIRLGGKYGKCINDLTEIEHYYYEGNYTTDGCIRTCYQDVINDECGCMDPRYPMPPSALSCKITKKSCLDDLITARGDPGQWDECNCPIPCTQTVYESKLSRLPFTQNITQCKNFKNGTEECYKAYADMVWLQIGMPSLRYLVYQESKFMDFSKLLSNVGGLLSILIGISIVSFVELFILMLNIMFIIISNRKI